MENHVYSVRFNGSKLRKITKEEGTHSSSFSPTTNYFIDSFSSLDTPPKVVVRNSSGSIKKVLAQTDRKIFDVRRQTEIEEEIKNLL